MPIIDTLACDWLRAPGDPPTAMLPTDNEHDSSVSAGRLFEVLWNALADVLGTAATAMLLRRAVRLVLAKRPELVELQGLDIIREGLEYRFRVPATWNAPAPTPVLALSHLVREGLFPLLRELTGSVVVALLERQPELLLHGVIAPGVEAP